MSDSRFLWRKLLFVVGPVFLLGFVLFASAIVWSVIRGVKQDAEFHVRNVTSINESMLSSVFSTSCATVVSATTLLEGLDAFPEEKRRPQGDAIVAGMLNNHYFYNAWAAYEPNLFDGPDAPHGDEYPGAPSGRYVRSYVRDDRNGEVVQLDDMDENTLNDPKESGWYTLPLETRKLHNDFDVYSYAEEEEAVMNLTISAPIMRKGKSVGVVGGDILVDQMVLSNELSGQIVTAGLSEEGAVIFAQDTRQIGVSLQDMRLPHIEQIQKAMQEKQEIFLQDEFSSFFDADAFIYLKPVRLTDFGEQTLYIYAAIPSSVVNQAIFVALRPVAIILVIMLLTFAALLFFVAYHVIMPIDQLARSIDEISGTGIVRSMPHLRRKDEIGDLARSVSRLWQYFRMRLNFLSVVKIKLEVYLVINQAIHKSLSFEEAAKHILRLLRIRCKADTARFFIYMGGRARLFALSGKAGEFHIRSVSVAPEFVKHEALAEALKGKDYLILKPYAMRLLNLEFIAPKAWSVCVLPIRTAKQLRAFIILESTDSRQIILHEDIVLNFISLRLANFFAHYAPLREQKQEEIPSLQGIPPDMFCLIGSDGLPEQNIPGDAEPDIAPETTFESESLESEPQTAQNLPQQPDDRTEEERFLDAARSVPALDVDKSLTILGNNIALYMEMLPLSARELGISMNKMEKFLESGDAHAFAIEVHACKGVLNTIGAFPLGDQALILEKFSKGDKLENCRQLYPGFASELAAFVDNLHTALPKKEEAPLEKRDIGDLVVDLNSVSVALDDFNLMLANERLRHAMRFSHTAPGIDEDSIAEKLNAISTRLDNIEYEEAIDIIQELLAQIGGDKREEGGTK